MNSRAEEKEVAKEEVVTTVKVGGDVLDISKFPPLTIGHKRRLFKEYNLDLTKISQYNPEEEFQFVLFITRLVRPKTTEQELEDVEIGSTVDIILGYVRSNVKEVDRPFSLPSPTSPGGGGGDPVT